MKSWPQVYFQIFYAFRLTQVLFTFWHASGLRRILITKIRGPRKERVRVKLKRVKRRRTGFNLDNRSADRKLARTRDVCLLLQGGVLLYYDSVIAASPAVL